MEENELRKKQEQAMREKQLAEEAKQHDPKVQLLLLQPFTSKVLSAGRRHTLKYFRCPRAGPGAEEEAAAARADRRAAAAAGQGAPARLRGQGRHHRRHHHRWDRRRTASPQGPDDRGHRLLRLFKVHLVLRDPDVAGTSGAQHVAAAAAVTGYCVMCCLAAAQQAAEVSATLNPGRRISVDGISSQFM